MAHAKNLVGLRFNRLTVLQRSETRNGEAYWLCRCECGTTTTVRGHHLRHDRIKSCGCLGAEITSARARTHGATAGGSRRREYTIWQQMRSRCSNPANQAFDRYGGRGIRIAPSWADFSNFLADMGPCPSGMSIERLNNDGDYTPENCVWATQKAQANNRRSSRWISLSDGRRLTLAQFAEERGVDYDSLRKALRWDNPEAAATRVADGRSSTRIDAILVPTPDGTKVTLREFCRLQAVPYLRVYHRVRFSGMTPADAVAATRKSLQANPKKQ